MKPTVGFVLTWMRADNSSGGVFQYAQRLVNALVKYTDLKIVAIVTGAIGESFKQLRGYNNFKEISIDHTKPFQQILAKDNIDVVHTPVQSNNLYTTQAPMIITLHDLQHIILPENFSEAEKKFRNIHYKKAAEFSERIIVSYDHVRDDIVKYFDIPYEKIDVCPFGIEQPLDLSSLNVDDIKHKYILPDNYIFYAANTWKHKNHINLIRALEVVHSKYKQDVHLICTGERSGDFYPVVENEILNCELEDKIHFLGYIPEKEMLKIMTNSTLVVIPTRYEAGSIPLIEAMNYGMPVICSNVTSLPRQIGDERFTFDPIE